MKCNLHQLLQYHRCKSTTVSKAVFLCTVRRRIIPSHFSLSLLVEVAQSQVNIYNGKAESNV